MIGTICIIFSLFSFIVTDEVRVSIGDTCCTVLEATNVFENKMPYRRVHNRTMQLIDGSVIGVHHTQIFGSDKTQSGVAYLRIGGVVAIVWPEFLIDMTETHGWVQQLAVNTYDNDR